MNTDIAKAVSDIIEDVKKNGDNAVLKYIKKFDGISFASLKDAKVSVKRILSAEKNVDKKLKKAILSSYKNVKAFHQKEYLNIKKNWFFSDKSKTVGQIYNPIESVALYVPGGKFSYPSTVIMTAVAAKVAGVKRIVIVTPPKKMSDDVLFTAKVCGIDEIYSIGGPVAIAAVAYGTKTISPVNMIVGPGNAYVNEAKRLVFGQVGIDSLAGPSEVAIIADNGACKDYIYYDLMAQIEHDCMSKAYLFCASDKIIGYLKQKIDKQFLKQIEMHKVSIEKAVERVNEIAPEHLELLVKEPKKIVKYIRNAGAVFAGYNTATAVGDYWAGPSHVLPTNASAKYSSGLSVMTFLKRSSYIELKNINSEIKNQIADFADAEGLVNHKKSIEVRKEQCK
ncbi:MAG: histidinol dehydrogenase [Endomicrobiaceae bacterium]|nr:histidinol dehydrogenase [Endomicrobiaceae bacterium]